jgi:hypothetical protein
MMARNILLSGLTVLMLGPQAHTVCFRDCSGTPQPAASCPCHDPAPSCCMMETQAPTARTGCDCDNCIEVQLPEEYCPVAPLPQFNHVEQTELPELQRRPFIVDEMSVFVRCISPLDIENRFLSQITDQLSATVIIA